MAPDLPQEPINREAEGPEKDLFAQQFPQSKLIGELPENDLQTDMTLPERVVNWVSRKRTALTLGSLAAASALMAANGNYAELKDQAIEAAPWVAGGLAVSEGMFIAGASMMIASIGDKVGNPLKIKEKIPAIAEKANDSKLFKAGFWINAIGAVGTAAVVTTGVAKELPPESYPLFLIPAIDLAITVKIRTMIRKAIKNRVNQNQLVANQEEIQ